MAVEVLTTWTNPRNNPTLDVMTVTSATWDYQPNILPLGADAGQSTTTAHAESGDFEIDFATKLDANTVGLVGNHVLFGNTSSGPGGLYIQWSYLPFPDRYGLIIAQAGGDAYYDAGYTLGSEWWYCTLKRTSTLVQCFIYSDSARTSLTDTLSFSPTVLNITHWGIDGASSLFTQGPDFWTKDIEWQAAAGPPIAEFSGDPLSGDAPLDVQFTDESDPNGDPITDWLWTFGDTETSIEEDPEHTYDDPGVYDVSLKVTNGEGNDTETKLEYITANEVTPVANFTGDPLSGYEPLEVAFTDTSTNTPTSWAWDFTNNGSTDSEDQHPSHTYLDFGVYTVKLTATNGAGSDDEIKVNYITVDEWVDLSAEWSLPTVQYSTDDGSSWDPVAKLFSVTPPTPTAGMIDVTTTEITDRHRRFIPEWIDGDVASFEVIFSDTTFDLLITLFVDRDVKWRIEWVDNFDTSTVSRYDFWGQIVEGPTPFYPLDDKWSIRVTIKLDGNSTYTAGVTP